MRVSINTYSYESMLKKGKTIIDIVDAVKKNGFDTIEIKRFDTPSGVTTEQYANEIKVACDKNELEVVAYTTNGDFLNGSNGVLKDEIERIKSELNIAKILGAKRMRHDVSNGPEKSKPASYEAALPRLAEGCTEVTKIAEQMGILTLTENHGYFSQDSERIEKLMTAVNHKNFRVLLDIGNFLCVDEKPADAVGRLLPFTAHIHAKDFYYRSGMAQNPGEGFFKSRGGNYLRGSIIGHGDVPVYQIIKQIKNYGYDDVISIEFEGLEDCEKAVRIGKENLERFWLN